VIKNLSPDEYDAILRSDLGYFAERCFCELNPQTEFLTNWHIEVIAAKLAAVREGKIRRLIINLPPRRSGSTGGRRATTRSSSMPARRFCWRPLVSGHRAPCRKRMANGISGT